MLLVPNYSTHTHTALYIYQLDCANIFYTHTCAAIMSGCNGVFNQQQKQKMTTIEIHDNEDCVVWCVMFSQLCAARRWEKHTQYDMTHSSAIEAAHNSVVRARFVWSYPAISSRTRIDNLCAASRALCKAVAPRALAFYCTRTAEYPGRLLINAFTTPLPGAKKLSI